MVAENVLVKRNVPHARAEGFVLAAKWRRALDRAVAAAHPDGQLRAGLRLLIVGVRDAVAVAEGVQLAAADTRVVWAARLDGPARYVLAFHVSAPEHLGQVDRLQGAFTAAGADCYQAQVTEVMNLPRLAKHARNIAPLDGHRGTAGALLPG
jgi:hypothetical protein